MDEAEGAKLPLDEFIDFFGEDKKGRLCPVRLRHAAVRLRKMLELLRETMRKGGASWVQISSMSLADMLKQKRPSLRKLAICLRSSRSSAARWWQILERSVADDKFALRPLGRPRSKRGDWLRSSRERFRSEYPGLFETKDFVRFYRRAGIEPEFGQSDPDSTTDDCAKRALNRKIRRLLRSENLPSIGQDAYDQRRRRSTARRGWRTRRNPAKSEKGDDWQFLR